MTERIVEVEVEWRVRIPAAIERAKLWQDSPPPVLALNAVALADELAARESMDLSDHLQEYCGGEAQCVAEHYERYEVPSPALRAFTETVEAL